MMTRRRALRALLVTLASASLAPVALPSAAAGDPAPVATIQGFCDTLLAVMKQGPALGFGGRRDRLAPAIRRAFDLPQMTRLTVGPQWPTLTEAQQRQLVDAFSNFSIATYASRFDDYSGERFDVDPTPAATTGGDLIVHTKLTRSDADPVQLDYLMRNGAGGWQIIDVYLSGTISELATRRSEFGAILERDGYQGLITALAAKSTESPPPAK
jgi:phospholipid transport system substrate-binding protein